MEIWMTSIKQVKDECSKCGSIIICELCKQGHGILQERNHVVEMLNCQLKHEEDRKAGKL